MARTDEERINQRPIKVVLGGTDRLIRPLVIKHSRIWKKHVAEAFTSLGALDVQVSDAESMKRTIDLLAITIPDKIAELVVAYDPTLNLEWFEENVTDEEATDTLFKMIEATFPFLKKAADLAKLSGALRG